MFYEVTQSFAKGYALANCSATKDPANKDLYIVAWAPFVERAMKSSEEHRNLENKCKRWKDTMRSLGAPRPWKAEVPGSLEAMLRAKHLF